MLINYSHAANLSDWLSTPVGNKFLTPIEDMIKEELNACLKSFYTSARKHDGQFYKSSSLKSIRAAIDGYLNFAHLHDVNSSQSSPTLLSRRQTKSWTPL